jgi:hypothetical protein
VDPIKVRRELFLLPEGPVQEQDVNSVDKAYMDLPMLILNDGRMVCQWMPDPNELMMLKEGVPVTIILHTGGRFTINPMQVLVGGADLRRA